MNSENKNNLIQIFGSFYLSDGEFALTVSHVQEVVNAPAGYTPVPLSPPYLKGLFNLRGTVIPVLDLHDLLHLKRDSQTDVQKIAIIELDGSCVGLLFDKTGEVFKSNDDERSDFESSHSNNVVCGVFKKDSGKRIVQILDVPKLFKLQNVPKDANHSHRGRESLGHKKGNRKQCISFVVGPAKCALAISDIQEILKIEKLGDSTLGIGSCIGTIDLRGTTVPVIDFPALLCYREIDRSDSASAGDRRVIVMRLENELFGLMVDSVDSIVSYFDDELLKFPMIEQKRSEMFLGCITGQGETDILLLNRQYILSDSEISEITHGHSRIYQNQSQAKHEAHLKGGARRTYITFSVDNSYAVAIHEVKEIIDYPKQLLQPPGMKKHVKGVLNLRGDMVTIIDARSLYTTNPSAINQDLQKVLVFKTNDGLYGLTVDSVESIITFSENDKIKLPTLLYDKGENSISTDISEAVEVTDSRGKKVSMLILNLSSVLARAA